MPLLAYTVDFLCVSAKLIVELDGARHGVDAEYDRRRTEELERVGFAVIRFKNDEILGDIDRALERIVTAALKADRLTLTPAPLPFGRGVPIA